MHIPPLPELAAVEQPQEGHRRQGFYYVLFFHYGPSRYRAAYKKFLGALAEVGDPNEAMRRHLEPLGYGEIQSECIRFRDDKIVYVTPK